MATEKVHLAIDLGATSGRVIAGKINDGKLVLEEVHRFPNAVMQINGKFYWNIYSLFNEIREGLHKAGKLGRIDSIGVDTWGVDFAFVAPDDTLIGLPRAYRDPYTDKAMKAYLDIVPKETVYGKTGIQFLTFNSVFQLYALSQEKSFALQHAKSLLFIPDAITYLLTGKRVCEYTILSTGQLLNVKEGRVDADLLAPSGVKPELFPELVMPGTTVGTLSPWLAEELEIPQVPVVAVAGHDTASAVAAVPAEDDNFAYLSSGTWSLIGIESPHPIISEESLADNFTNEGGVFGTTRFLKNITGMWLLEQCRKEWTKAGKDYSYPQLVEMAMTGTPFKAVIDPDDPGFANPRSMTRAIAEYCAAHNIDAPANDSEIVRCIFESLALKYRFVLERLKKYSPHPISCLHVIGGGSKNALLNQFTANAIGMPVVAGPSEATACGNVLLQAYACGEVANLSEMRRIVAHSSELDTFTPEASARWEEAYNKNYNGK